MEFQVDAPEVIEQADITNDGYDWPEKSSLPVISESSRKPYEDYTRITDTTSKQWRLLHGKETHFEADGTISINGYIAAALGSKFGSVGSKFLFILENEDGERTAVRIVKADEKADQDTLDGWQGKNGHVMEMIVRTEWLSGQARTMGDLNEVPKLEGKIIRILKVKGEETC